MSHAQVTEDSVPALLLLVVSLIPDFGGGWHYGCRCPEAVEISF